MKRLFLLSAITLISVVAHADVYDDGAYAARGYHRGTVDALTQLQLGERTQIALNQMIAAANEKLAEEGYTAEAEQNQNEWDRAFSSYFLAFNMMNLGDHQPLNAWLDNFYKKTEEKLGAPVMRLLHFDDIRTINYAIPVVFQPKGDKRNGDHWNQEEYNRHFILFASVVTYWGSLTACKLVAIKLLPMRRWCGLVAQILRGAMNNMIAPRLSVYVYTKANGKSTELGLDLAAIDQQYSSQISSLQKP